ncbi:MAG: hypothetical protein WC341_00600 [Bacteroidales bacterium]|jgi:hypothetical protein
MGDHSEIELAEKIIEWLNDQHWQVYQEVQVYSNIADIVAVKGSLVWIIECKTSMTLTVMDQARRWNSHFRSIAIPAAKSDRGRSVGYAICKDYLHIGVLEVDKMGYVQEIVPAPLMREYNKFVKILYLNKLCEAQKTYAKAGNNNGRRYTPYRQTIIGVQEFIQEHPGCTLKDIMNYCETHYAPKSAKASLRSALASFERDWCMIETSGKESHYYIKTGSDDQ